MISDIRAGFDQMIDVLTGSLQVNPWVLYAILAIEVLVLVVSFLLLLRYAKFTGYMLRNARRNAVRSLLTVGSITISLFLMMVLMSLLAVIGESASNLRDGLRLITLSSQGFAQPIPIALMNDIRATEGVVAASPLSWYGGKYMEENMPFAQFGCDPETVFSCYDEFTVPPDQLAAFKSTRTGCVIGRKLAEERQIKLGDPLPLKGTIYPFDLDLTVVGIYDGPPERDLRTVFYNWDYLDEGLKASGQERRAGNAGCIVIKCRDSAIMPAVTDRIDSATRNSDTPTRTQTEEAFVKIFLEMYGDVRGLIRNVGIAVIFSLMCVAGNAMAMSLRERTTEVAVLRAMGFDRPLVVSLVLAEAVLVAGIGGLIGAFGSKLLFHTVDISQFMSQFVAFFYIPWPIAVFGLGAALLIGFVSGIIPAVRAANLSVIDGLRKVV
jgi:putative ABC transport system permease protein